jgi:hypothetical protein
MPFNAGRSQYFLEYPDNWKGAKEGAVIGAIC